MKRYILNQEQNILLKWLDNSDKIIDMQQDNSLKNIIIIGECAFLDCTEVEELVLPEKLVSIRHGAFLGCRKLTKIYIPESVTQWEFSAFLCCENLDLLELPERITKTKIGKAIDIPDFIERLIFERIDF